MEKISQPLSNKLANMGLFCALLVLFIHIPMMSVNVGPWLIRAYFSHGIGKIAVPFFFVSSGYLLARHFDEDMWHRKEVLKRIKTLLVPLVGWCIIWYLTFGLLFTVAANIVAGRELFANVSMGLTQLLRIFAIYPFSQPYLGVLWFVRTLFILVLASPFLLRVSTPPWVILFWVLNGIIFPDYGVKITPVLFTFQEGFISIFGAAYFCAGIMLQRQNFDINVSYRIGLPCLLIGSTLLIIRGLPYQDLMSRVLTWLYIPFLMVGVWWACPSTKPLKYLKGMAFPVYVLHMFSLTIISMLVKACGMNWMTTSCCTGFGYVLKGLVAFVASVVIATIMRETVPTVAKILFGGR